MPIVHNLSVTVSESDELYLRRDADSGPNKDLAYDLGSASLRWVNIYSVNFHMTSTQSLYADVAERFEADCAMEEGDIAILGGEKEITHSIVPYDANILGIVSKKPALQMNSEYGPDETHPYIALVGTVPCKVFGVGRKGQRIVSSGIRGVAQVLNDDTLFYIPPFCVIGRLLENKVSEDVMLVSVVVGAK